jgi:HSP20 family protein
MANAEDKFFEDLANFGNSSDDGYDAELSKATTLSVTHARTAPKRAPAVEEVEEEYSAEPEGQLTIDVYQTPSDIIIESAIAGVRPEDIDINVTNDSITIRGERRRDHQIKDEDYFYQECYWGRFARSVILPQEVDPDSATVSFRNGVLTVRLPKMNRRKARKLKVRLE